MKQILSFLAEHGGAVLFVVVLIEQLGLPLPSLPWIIAAGAVAADGRIHLPATLTGIVAACLISFLTITIGCVRAQQTLTIAWYQAVPRRSASPQVPALYAGM
jgi:membrane protein DedA with SNARE-associated domain